jgi:hypothetical protein
MAQPFFAIVEGTRPFLKGLCLFFVRSYEFEGRGMMGKTMVGGSVVVSSRLSLPHPMVKRRVRHKKHIKIVRFISVLQMFEFCVYYSISFFKSKPLGRFFWIFMLAEEVRVFSARRGIRLLVEEQEKQ